MGGENKITVVEQKPLDPKSSFANGKEAEKKTCQKFHPFRDEEFTSDNSSIFFSDDFLRSKANRDLVKNLKWLRPKEISEEAKFIIDDTSRVDVKQGYLGDCWVLAAIASLTQKPELLKEVLNFDQDFDKNYTGNFQFRFWQYGEWVKVIVDDQLPTNGRELVYVRSTTPNEYWSALLEKAYAKLNGSYEAINVGVAMDAMVDLTGGVSEVYSEPHDKELFEYMLKSYEEGSILCCYICKRKINDYNKLQKQRILLQKEEKVQEQQLLENQLPEYHSYSIVSVKSHNCKECLVNHSLIRIRNPWGDKIEWKGPWSDASSKWNCMSIETKMELGWKNQDNDGEFSMAFEDFQQHFDRVEFCHIPTPTGNINTVDNGKKWNVIEVKGEWTKPLEKNGVNNKKLLFSHPNPKYNLRVIDPDKGDSKFTVIIELMQKRKMNTSPTEMAVIGFEVFQREHSGNGSQEILKRCGLRFDPYRQVSRRLHLSPGDYVIEPSMKTPANESTEFLLRILFEGNAENGKVRGTTVH